MGPRKPLISLYFRPLRDGGRDIHLYQRQRLYRTGIQGRGHSGGAVRVCGGGKTGNWRPAVQNPSRRAGGLTSRKTGMRLPERFGKATWTESGTRTMRANGCRKFRSPSEGKPNNPSPTGTLRRVRFCCGEPRRIANRQYFSAFAVICRKKAEKPLQSTGKPV